MITPTARLLTSFCALSLAACGDQRLLVGETYDAEVSDVAPGDALPADSDGSVPSTPPDATDPLRVELRDGRGATTSALTLACGATCTEVEAIALGGNPPYSYRWQDGGTGARRTLCEAGT